MSIRASLSSRCNQKHTRFSSTQLLHSTDSSSIAARTAQGVGNDSPNQARSCRRVRSNRILFTALRSTSDRSACPFLSRRVNLSPLRVAPIDRSPAAGSLHRAGCEDEWASVTGPAKSFPLAPLRCAASVTKSKSPMTFRSSGSSCNPAEVQTKPARAAAFDHIAADKYFASSKFRK
jgi:hypothetical protein